MRLLTCPQLLRQPSTLTVLRHVHVDSLSRVLRVLMKSRIAILATGLLLGAAIFSAQTHSEAKSSTPAACGLERSDLQDEAKDLAVYTQRMQARIVMIRNSAGIVENPQARNALQVDADMWQDELDHLKVRMTRLQAAIDRCEARERISGAAK